MPRITPVSPPYPPDVEAALRKWMPPAATQDPLMLFRVLQRNPDLASRMRVVGSGLLGHGTLPHLDREIVIARVCARCGCHYEWGVHAASFATAVGLTREQLEATVLGPANAPVWTDRHQALIQAVDELHDHAQLSDSTWDALCAHLDEPQLLELLVLNGWYHTISYLANALQLPDEPWATAFPT